MRPKRPKTLTKTCSHCNRRRPRLKIEWHPGVMAWQCSDSETCNEANEAIDQHWLRRGYDQWA